MRKFRPPFLGQEDGWFSWVGTSPGRIDPTSGEFVESGIIPEKERTGFFDWIPVSPGRIDPRTGKVIIPTSLPKEQRERLRRTAGGERETRSSERALSRFGGGRRREEERERSFVPSEIEMNGPYEVGCDTCGMGDAGKDGGPGAILWIFLGATAAIALEAFGVTAWSKK